MGATASNSVVTPTWPNSRLWGRLTLGAISFVIGLYMAEVITLTYDVTQAYLETRARREAAKRSGRRFDERSKLEVVIALRQAGRNAQPAVHPSTLLQSSPDGARRSVISTRGAEAIPFSGISGATTVYCNETGEYLVYQSDVHGFHNPAEAWTRERLDIAAIGDSFAHGACVSSGQNMIERIRETYAATINLGYGGNGPLLELGALREYLPVLKPRVVLWFFAENDLVDLEKEKTSPLLMRYVRSDQDFQQGLIDRQAEMDHALAAYVEALAIETTKARTSVTSQLAAFVKLNRVRELIWRWRHPPTEDYELFDRILAKAGALVSGWGGKLYLVYLPAPLSLQHRMLPVARRRDEMRRRVTSLARSRNIAVIDLFPVFMAQRKQFPTLFYPYYAHYTTAGYALAARGVLDQLAAAERTPQSVAKHAAP